MRRGAVSHMSSVMPRVHSALALWDPEVRKAEPFARRSTGKVRVVWRVKCALSYRIPPEADDRGVGTRKDGSLS
jgi:hypothetical protein